MTNEQRLIRRGSVYIAVTGTAVLVSLVGFTAIHLSRVELSRTTAQNQRAYARQLAQTGVEFALGAIDLDPYWRSNFNHNVEYSVTPLAVDEDIYFRFLDNLDGDLADDPDDVVEIQGIGRYGGATSIYSVTYARSVTSSDQTGPLVLSSFTTGAGNNSADNITNTNWYGQYFLPSLPANATSWAVTSAVVQIKRAGAATDTLQFGLQLPDGSLKPGTVLETIAVNESQLPSSHDWYEVGFQSVQGLDPNVGLCLTIETTGNSAGNIRFEAAGVTASNAHILTNSGGGWTVDSTKSLFYRIHGMYSTSTGSGQFTITPGSWRSTEN